MYVTTEPGDSKTGFPYPCLLQVKWKNDTLIVLASSSDESVVLNPGNSNFQVGDDYACHGENVELFTGRVILEN